MREIMFKASCLTKVFAFGLFLLSVPVRAQVSNVGELIDKGGKKLTKEEIAALLSGATMQGVQPGTGARFNNALSADGFINGQALLASGRTVAVYGKWSIDEQGQYCQQLSTNAGAQFSNCWFWFVLGGAYYAATTDDRTGALFVRDIVKQ